MAELVFHTGPMDSGKSTLALQMDHAQSAHDRQGVRYAMHDRSGGARITSRIGLSVEAVEVTDSLDLYQDVVARLSRGGRIDYLICDEAQFYRPEQIDQLQTARRARRPCRPASRLATVLVRTSCDPQRPYRRRRHGA